MLGRVRGRDGGEVEALVRERLRSILAAATPRSGWVPERISESGAPGGPPVPEESELPSTSVTGSALQAESPGPLGPDQVLDRPESPGSPAAGRHRGDTGSDTHLRWDPGRPGALALCVVAVLAALLAAGLTWLSQPSPSTVGESGTGALVAATAAAAGGALPEADLTTVNLARLVVDGEQIAVGVPGSSLPGDANQSTPGGLVNLNTATQAELEELPGIGPVLAQRIVDFREENEGFTGVEQLREVSGIGPTVYEDIVDLVTV